MAFAAHGCESWTIRKFEESRIEVLESFLGAEMTFHSYSRSSKMARKRTYDFVLTFSGNFGPILYTVSKIEPDIGRKLRTLISQLVLQTTLPFKKGQLGPICGARKLE